MTDPLQVYAQNLTAWLLDLNSSVLQAHPDDPTKVFAVKKDGSYAELNLMPFAAQPKPVTAQTLFSQVTTVADLIDAYHQGRRAITFESDMPNLMGGVDPYASQFLSRLMSNASQLISDDDALLMGEWLQRYDIYVAVKSIESLLNSKADLAVLRLAKANGWQVHFDHLAIRCGSATDRAAEQVADMLMKEHAYAPSQLPDEKFYQFPAGWNAYPLYKILENGQVIRLFIDQSDGHHPKQIIQHWNRVYGFTAHHLAMRVSQRVDGCQQAIPLNELMMAMQTEGVALLAATGEYTHGLLEQVFTQPEKNINIPLHVKTDMQAIDAELQRVIENGKLLELVSRMELPDDMRQAFFALYGLDAEQVMQQVSAPVFHYFLPAQAAHVIKTSVA